jgi:outer membrane biosynthesis protein TonB
MDNATKETVKTWRFKPAMCGNEPIAFDIHVEVNFQLR